MARPMRSIDLDLPPDDNDGEPIPESKYVALQQELLNRFGGVTSVRRQFALQDVWQFHADRSPIIRLVTQQGAEAGFLEVAVGGQCFVHPALGRDDERDAVGQRPSLVALLSEQLRAAVLTLR